MGGIASWLFFLGGVTTVTVGSRGAECSLADTVSTAAVESCCEEFESVQLAQENVHCMHVATTHPTPCLCQDPCQDPCQDYNTYLSCHEVRVVQQPSGGSGQRLVLTHLEVRVDMFTRQCVCVCRCACVCVCVCGGGGGGGGGGGQHKKEWLVISCWQTDLEPDTRYTVNQMHVPCAEPTWMPRSG